MKIIRDNICYVSFKDLVYFEFPNELNYDKESYEKNDYVILKDSKDIEYVRNREDILDYDTLYYLSESDLNKKIKKIEKKLEPLYIKLSQSSKDDKELLLRNEKFRNILFKYDKVYYDLIHYRNNKDEEDEKIYMLLNDKCQSKSFAMV